MCYAEQILVCIILLLLYTIMYRVYIVLTVFTLRIGAMRIAQKPGVYRLDVYIS